MTTILKSKIFWFIALTLVVLGGFVVSRRNSPPEISYNSIQVERQNLIQTVDESGTVVSDPDTTISFSTSGKIQSIEVEVGDIIEEGELIAILDSESEESAVAQQRAALSGAQAALDLKRAGASDEDIAVTEAALEKSRVDLEKIELNLERITTLAERDIKRAQLELEKARTDLAQGVNTSSNTAVDNAYKTKRIGLQGALISAYNALQEADKIVGVNDVSLNDPYESGLSKRNLTLITDAKNLFISAYDSYEKSKADIDLLNINTAYAQIDSAGIKLEVALEDIAVLLIKVKEVLDYSVLTSGLTQSVLDSFKTSIDTVETAVTSARSTIELNNQSVSNAQNSFASLQQVVDLAIENLETVEIDSEAKIEDAKLAVEAAKATLQSQQAALDLKVADPREVDLSELRARVLQQQAFLDSSLQALEKRKLYAPFSGIIADIYKDKGEFITSAEPFSLLIAEDYHIEVDIPESDIAKVSVGDKVGVMFDAFSDRDPLVGSVTFIEPSQTEISGVVYYTVMVSIDDFRGLNIRPGMTSDVIIYTDSKNNVLTVPQRALLFENGTTFVRIVTNPDTGEYRKVPVTTGLQGDDGIIEITSGLKEGDDVITFIDEEK